MLLLDSETISSSPLVQHGRDGSEQEVWTSELTSICSYTLFSYVAELKHKTSAIFLLDHPAKDGDK